ncbi:MAG: U32 family peptidase [Bacilli bacterium]|nr:U32 family peptidase [Bacilli bacterium]
MKKSVIISSLLQAKELKDLIDAYIVPIDDFSINYDKTFSIEEVKKILELGNEVFVLVNKNIHNNEIDELKKFLLEIESIFVNGIIFYDIAIVNMKNKYKLKTPLVWAQEHLTTNHRTINYWQAKGVEYAFLSSEITKKEIDEIRKNTKAKLFVLVFGHIPMFTSRRHLVNNYIKYFSLNDEFGGNKIYKEGKKYPILDRKNGTTVYSDYILNVTDYDFSLFDYVVYNSYLIDDMKDVLIDNKYPLEHGFMDKETIYRVKKND